MDGIMWLVVVCVALLAFGVGVLTGFAVAAKVIMQGITEGVKLIADELSK